MPCVSPPVKRTCLLGCDLLVAAGPDAIAKLDSKISHAVVNSQQTPTAEFTRNPDAVFPAEAMKQTIIEAVGAAKTHFVEATSLATRLMGDSIGQQPVHARLCVSAGPDSIDLGGHREGHRTQRRSGQSESAGVSLGASYCA
ncbi:hypothetical protein [Pseudomonas syringae]|uniref:hypothetical protein n=1 Tax=Pseudomonas syringae TaxID=317 RepID=UPI0031FD8894